MSLTNLIHMLSSFAISRNDVETNLINSCFHHKDIEIELNCLINQYAILIIKTSFSLNCALF